MKQVAGRLAFSIGLGAFFWASFNQLTVGAVASLLVYGVLWYQAKENSKRKK